MRSVINEYGFYMIKLVSYLSAASSPPPPFRLNYFLNFVLKLLVLHMSLTECPCYSMMEIQLLVITWAL